MKTTWGQSESRRPLMRFATVIAVVAAAFFVFGCQGDSGGGSNSSLASPLTSATVGGADNAGGTPLTLDDLQNLLNLTQDQTGPMQTALDKLNASRPAPGEGPGHGPRDGNGPGPRGEGQARPAGGMHQFLIDCADFLDSQQMVNLINYLKEKRDEQRQARQDTMQGRQHDRSGQRLERLLAQLDLTDEQTAAVTDLFDQHRAKVEELLSQSSQDGPPDADTRAQLQTLREEFQQQLEAIVGADNMAKLKDHTSPFRRGMRDRPDSETGDRAGRSIEFLTVVLHLTETQQSQIKDIFSNMADAMKAIRDAIPEGQRPSDDQIAQMKQLREDANTAIAATLTAEQSAVFEALKGMMGPHGPGGMRHP